MTEHKRICKRPQNVLKRKKALKSVKKLIESSSESGDSEDATEDSEDKEESETELELVELRPLISIPQEGGVEKILNVKEWLKLPWILEQDE